MFNFFESPGERLPHSHLSSQKKKGEKKQFLSTCLFYERKIPNALKIVLNLIFYFITFKGVVFKILTLLKICSSAKNLIKHNIPKQTKVRMPSSTSPCEGAPTHPSECSVLRYYQDIQQTYFLYFL